MKRYKVYVAGPMRGHYEFNFPAFISKTAELRAHGYEVHNPAEEDLKNGFQPWGLQGTEDLEGLGFNLRQAMAEDLEYICKEADAIYFLPGWTDSKGARTEYTVGKFLGLKMLNIKEGDLFNCYNNMLSFLID